ncbi:DUF2786 domain-containing protein [Corynebacterium uterequi]|uniref:DUF2786 domain-containing protein n=1 Tax=Corynebacterium uterequi TaxID=1072256 RepID=UPI0006417F8D|nr:DUF2786 domain-containing protein [Corynebacterium uterequi]
MSTTSAHDIASKVAKLLAKAADTDGTPESEVYYAKAFDLMARYGIDEASLSEGDRSDMIQVRIDFRGAYTDMQRELLASLVHGLRCAYVYHSAYRSNRVESATVYGQRRNVERVHMLLGVLSPTMLALALDHHGDPSMGISTVSARRSFMLGFSRGIYRRIHAAEHNVAEQTLGSGAELALLDESDQAAEFMRRLLEEEGIVTRIARPSRRTLSAEAYYDGESAAEGADIGQSRIRGTRALNAAG